MNKLKKRINFTLILVLLFTLACIPNFVYASPSTEIEPNDSSDQANLLQLVNGQAYMLGTLTNSSDIDYFEYTADVNSDVELLLIPDNPSTNYFYAIWDTTNGQLLVQKTTSVYQYEYFELNAGHKCLIAITSTNANNSSYQISFIPNEAQRQITLEGQYEMESNDTPEIANILPTTYKLYCGSITDSNDYDYYTFTANESKNMKFSFYPGCSANFFIMVFDITSQQYITVGYIKTPGSYEETPFSCIEGHEYRVAIVADSPATNSNYYFQFWDN